MKPALNRLETYYLLTNVKGVMIFVLVLYHFVMESFRADNYGGIRALGLGGMLGIAPLILLFFCAVPLFVFVTGFSSKDTDSCRETAFSLYFIPYLLLSVVMALEYGLINGLPIYFFPFEPLMQLWYLLAMFLWMLLLKDVSRIKGILVISYLITLVIGMRFNNPVLAASSGVGTFLSLSRVLYFFPFLLLGFFMKPETLSRLCRVKWQFAALAAAGFAALSVGTEALCCRGDANGIVSLLVLNGNASYQERVQGMNHLQINLFGALLTVLLTAMTLCLLVTMLRFMPKKKIPFLTRLGDASLTVFSLHVFLTIPLTGQIAKLPLVPAFFVSIGAAAITCFLLSLRPVHKTYSRFIFRIGDAIRKK